MDINNQDVVVSQSTQNKTLSTKEVALISVASTLVTLAAAKAARWTYGKASGLFHKEQPAAPTP